MKSCVILYLGVEKHFSFFYCGYEFEAIRSTLDGSSFQETLLASPFLE